MAIAKKHFFHGAALSLITVRGEFTGLARLKDLGAAAYAVNHNIGIYIKHTEKEDSPWTFGFSPEHQEAMQQLNARYGDHAFLVLVCPPAGVCLLTYGQYQQAIDENLTEQENIIVRRPGGGGFRVSGANGRVPGVIPVNRFPELLFG